MAETVAPLTEFEPEFSGREQAAAAELSKHLLQIQNFHQLVLAQAMGAKEYVAVRQKLKHRATSTDDPDVDEYRSLDQSLSHYMDRWLATTPYHIELESGRVMTRPYRLKDGSPGELHCDEFVTKPDGMYRATHVLTGQPDEADYRTVMPQIVAKSSMDSQLKPMDLFETFKVDGAASEVVTALEELLEKDQERLLAALTAQAE